MLNVKTEVGRLRKVMLHRPGGELLNLSPLNLEPLLFDDIPFLEVAQAEHDAFARMLADEGVEVVYVEDLVTEVLEAKPILRDQYIRDYVRESGLAGCRVTSAVIDYLRGIEHAHAESLCRCTLLYKVYLGLLFVEVCRVVGWKGCEGETFHHDWHTNLQGDELRGRQFVL